MVAVHANEGHAELLRGVGSDERVAVLFVQRKSEGLLVKLDGLTVVTGGEFPVADAAPGPLTLALRETLTGIQRGARPDPHRWLTPLG